MTRKGLLRRISIYVVPLGALLLLIGTSSSTTAHGGTATHALLTDSPAVDAGRPLAPGSNGTSCAPVDQRDMPRPVDGDGVAVCDIGSYENEPMLYPTKPLFTGATPDQSLPGQLFTVEIIVTSAYGIPTGTVMISVSDKEESCLIALEGGVGTCTLSIDAPGFYTLTAAYSGDEEFSSSIGTTEHKVNNVMFVPLLAKYSLSYNLDLVITRWFRFPGLSSSVYGYVIGRGTTYYSTRVGIDVSGSRCGCKDEECCYPFEYTTSVSPAFTATIPGQINPFSWYFYCDLYTCGHAEDVYLKSTTTENPTGFEYYPVRVLNWNLDDKVLTGTVRNDSGRVLQDVKVVAAANECAWKGAVVTKTTLQPGEGTDFQIGTFKCDTNVFIVGQGRADE